MAIPEAMLWRAAGVRAYASRKAPRISARFFEPSWFGASRTWPAFAFSRLGLRAP